MATKQTVQRLEEMLAGHLALESSASSDNEGVRMYLKIRTGKGYAYIPTHQANSIAKRVLARLEKDGVLEGLFREEIKRELETEACILLTEAHANMAEALRITSGQKEDIDDGKEESEPQTS